MEVAVVVGLLFVEEYFGTSVDFLPAKDKSHTSPMTAAIPITHLPSEPLLPDLLGV
jgi:hypothetical protein